MRDAEPSLNHLTAAHPAFALTAGYYYGLLHFIVTPLVLAWLWVRPAGRVRAAALGAGADHHRGEPGVLDLALAPPPFSVPGMTDYWSATTSLARPTRTARPAWSAWTPPCRACMWPGAPGAAAVVTTTRTRWRHLAWLYPAATTLVGPASADDFLLDAVAGLVITTLGLLATRADRPPDTAEPSSAPGGSLRAARAGILGAGRALT